MRTMAKAALAAAAWAGSFPAPAAAVGFGISSGVDYQDRSFVTGSIEYDCRQVLFFIQPRLDLGSGWNLYARIGYSNLVYDRPSQGGRDYDEWGYEWGAGLGWTPFRWSGFYLGTEGGFSMTRTSASSGDVDYLNWGVDIKGGWDLGVVDAFVGGAYDDGLIRDSPPSDAADSSRKDYRLEHPLSFFAGARIDVPFLPRIEGRYYFGEDRLALLALAYDF